MRKLNYRNLVYIGTFLTGATGLVFQVVWQKYLVLLVGGESRSISLIIACFLFGLATGYHFWGKLTPKKFSRSQFLKIYGSIEALIGLYAIIFPSYFRIIQDFAYASNPSLTVDILSSFLLLFPPTFLMGATIPLLTTLLPEKMDEVNNCHSKIYGINTLGAFLGTLLGGFIIIPSFGLSTSLMICGLLNITIGFIFLFNKLKGRIFETFEEMPSFSENFGSTSLTIFVFVSGAVLISLEVIFVRLVGLAIGTGHFTYPIIVGIFILGLALGSLSITSIPTNEKSFIRQIYLSIITLILIYLSAPFWPYWISHIRVSLTSLPTNYHIYLTFVFIFLFLILTPFLVFAGRLLPMAYSLINKTSEDYGKVCGRLYFFNTLGTVIGSIFLAHILISFVNLDLIFKINIGLMLALLAMLIFLQKKIKTSIALLLGMFLFIAFFPAWERSSHYLGLFRYRGVEDFHFSGFFNLPKESGKILFFKDDPNSTVSVIETLSRANTGRSIIVNGKSDGNTFSHDSSTMLLLGSLAYFHSPSKSNLQAAVIGFGTGISAGIIGRGKDVGNVTVLEISPAVIEASIFFQNDNYNANKNSKIDIIQDDAFRFFTRGAQHSKLGLDMIVSEPSNPWVVGVENLFSLSFYKLVKKVLRSEGVFVQWLQLYEIDRSIFISIISNLLDSFKYIKIYQVSDHDLAIVASEIPISNKEFKNRFFEPEMKNAHKFINILDPDQLILQTFYQGTELKKLVASSNLKRTHDFDTPVIGYASGKEMFLGNSVDENKLFDDDVARLVRFDSNLYDSLTRFTNFYPNGPGDCTNQNIPTEFFCLRIKELSNAFFSIKKYSKINSESQLLKDYQLLREAGIYPANINFLYEIEKRIIKKSNPFNLNDQRLIALYLTQLLREGLYKETLQSIAKLHAAGAINENHVNGLMNVISKVNIKMEKFLAL
jgi:spermidine synthase